ncbi:MAG: YibE/F family protein [bacterium]|nr:YibE/F family protein [bacterium]
MSFLKPILFIIAILSFVIGPQAFAQEVHQDVQGIWRARVIEVINQEKKTVPGTDTLSTYQTLKAELLEGERKGQVVTIENDYLTLKNGDKFFLFYTIDINGNEMYSVRDIDRRVTIGIFVGLFVLTIIAFGGKQGLRSIISLAGSFFVILYVLVPSLLKGYPPVPTSIAIASVILFLAIFLTHGFNRESLVAFIGTVSAVILTGILAYLGVTLARLSGFASDEAVYLNLATRGALDFSGLLLGGIMIGVLGVLDDIAVTQSAVVSELYNSASHLSKKEIYTKAIRVGKEHVGALVNTLALAYTGASLPLLLLFSTSESTLASIINQEIFATEIIRTIVGSVGLILTVPITTLLAVYMLKGYKVKHNDHHGHSHVHH